MPKMNRRMRKRSVKRRRKSVYRRKSRIPRPLKPDGQYVEKIVRTMNWVNGTTPYEGVN